MPTTIIDTTGEELISIGRMAKLAKISASALRGYEKLGILRSYGVEVIRDGDTRYYRKSDAFKITQIKAERITRRNVNLANQVSNRANR